MFSEISTLDARATQAPPMHVAKHEVEAVLEAIEAGEVLYRDVSPYLLRTIVALTIAALDEHRANGS
jgi:hypothetical protein